LRAFVTLLLPDGTLKQVVSGDLIGRLPSAAVFLDDERVSEAHALVSLRGADLKILSLRGRLIVDGKAMTEAVLEEGMVIEPAPGLELTVASVALPDAVLALQGEGLPRQILGGTTSILLTPRPAIVQRYVGDAVAWVWPVGDGCATASARASRMYWPLATSLKLAAKPSKRWAIHSRRPAASIRGRRPLCRCR
jgi:hypothetical protein